MYMWVLRDTSRDQGRLDTYLSTTKLVFFPQLFECFTDIAIMPLNFIFSVYYKPTTVLETEQSVEDMTQKSLSTGTYTLGR